MEMLSKQVIGGTLFVAFVGICVSALGWITTTLIHVDKTLAVIAVKVDANHSMLQPMWEEFTGRTYDANLAQFHPKTNFKPTIKAEF
jgi:hypothetical protein